MFQALFKCCWQWHDVTYDLITFLFYITGITGATFTFIWEACIVPTLCCFCIMYLIKQKLSQSCNFIDQI